MSYEATICDDVLDLLRRRARRDLAEADQARGTAELTIDAVSELKDARAEVRRLRVLLKRSRGRLRGLVEHSDLISQVPVDHEHHWKGTRVLITELDAYFGDGIEGDVTPEELRVVGHPSGERFVMVFSDETAEERTSEQMEAFVDNLRSAAAYLGLDIQMWGPERAVTERLSAHAHSILTTARELFGGKAGE